MVVWSWVGSRAGSGFGGSKGVIQAKSAPVNSISCIQTGPATWERRAAAGEQGKSNLGAAIRFEEK